MDRMLAFFMGYPELPDMTRLQKAQWLHFVLEKAVLVCILIGGVAVLFGST